MNVRSVLSLLTLALLLCVFTVPSRAEEVIEAWRGDGFSQPAHVSVNPTDGSCWLNDASSVVHLSEDGTELWRGWQFTYPASVSVNSTDGSCWVADSTANQVVHLAADGTELWRGGGFGFPVSVSVNPADGSCWVADIAADEVVHLWADGTELFRAGGFTMPMVVSANPADDSCWVGDQGHRQVVHLAEDGVELWRGGAFSYLSSLSVNSTDGSCWVVDAANGTVVHLNAQGGELWRGAIGGAVGVSVNSTDGSCWVAAGYSVVHLAADGGELSRVGGYDDLSRRHSVSANSADGSCWVSDVATEVHEVLHLAIPGWQPSIFYDVPCYYWAFGEVGACYEADIVGGYDDGLYHPGRTLSRDQMAVFISRSIATPTGEMSLDEYVPPTIPSFTDVPTDFWAYKYIEYAAEHNIVGGYGDGTYQPQLNLDRGQMAVFIARAMVGDDESVPDPTGDPSFPDVPADFWSYRHIEYIAAEEVAGGYYDGLYHPENPVDRAQMAVFICRAFNLL